MAAVQGIRPLTDDALRAVLAGEASGPDAEAGRLALAAAATAFGALDCARARKEAEAAVLRLAAAQAASGSDVAAELIQAHVYRLICADQAGDPAGAQAAAAALHRLGAVDPPGGVSDAVWSRYPSIDATTGVRKGMVAISTQPDGASIWVDHQPAGKAPVTVTLSEGEHLVAAAAPDGRAVARLVAVAPSWTPARIALALPPAVAGAGRTHKIAARIRALKSGATRLDPASLGRLLADAELSFAVVIDARGRLGVWKRRGRTARDLGRAGNAIELAALIADADRPPGPGIDPTQPLLRETPDERAEADRARRGEGRQQWWVYAAIIGAVVVGAGIVAAQDLGDDRQRIEITFP